jgi:hypothetical protein
VSDVQNTRKKKIHQPLGKIRITEGKQIKNRPANGSFMERGKKKPN